VLNQHGLGHRTDQKSFIADDQSFCCRIACLSDGNESIDLRGIGCGI